MDVATVRFKHQPRPEVQLGKNGNGRTPVIEKTTNRLHGINWQQNMDSPIGQPGFLKGYDRSDRRRR
jgi:hypothetical protein